MTDAVAIGAHAVPAYEEPSGRAPRGFASIATFAGLVVLAGAVLLPIVATALGGFKELGELHSNPIGLPSVWVWSNYWSILTSLRYWQVLGNSLLIAMLTVALTLMEYTPGAVGALPCRIASDTKRVPGRPPAGV